MLFRSQFFRSWLRNFFGFYYLNLRYDLRRLQSRSTGYYEPVNSYGKNTKITKKCLKKLQKSLGGFLRTLQVHTQHKSAGKRQNLF